MPSVFNSIQIYCFEIYRQPYQQEQSAVKSLGSLNNHKISNALTCSLVLYLVSQFPFNKQNYWKAWRPCMKTAHDRHGSVQPHTCGKLLKTVLATQTRCRTIFLYTTNMYCSRWQMKSSRAYSRARVGQMGKWD